MVSTILKTVAESNAELARYMEYLFKESKWDTAQNISSVAAAAGQLGYRPARKRSAFGQIYISADPRIHLVGRRYSWDSFINNEVCRALSSTIEFNSDVIITDSKDNSYIMTTTSALKAGQSYVVNSIIQGKKKIVSIPIEVARVIATRSKLDPYLFIPVYIENCENATTAATQKFFRVFVVSGSSREEYRVVDTLHLSSSADTDVEVYADLYDSNLLYLKFNTSPIRGKVLSLSPGSGVTAIEIQYVETNGKAGNLTRSFEPFTLSNIPGRSGLNLYGINFDAIIGGADEESVYEIKTNAPLYYMNTYTAATQEAYENLIRRIPFYDGTYASKVRVFPGFYEDPDTHIARNVTYVTLLLPGLEDFVASTTDQENPYESIERTINFYLAKLKSPTDILKFSPPRYVSIALGITSTANREEVENLAELKAGMVSLLDDTYGARSPKLDFGRAVYESDIIASLKSYSNALQAIKLELEAVVKLDWATAIRMQPDISSPLYTVRLNFGFNPIFKGSNYIKGFKDYRTGASYVLRFDIMYKQALTSTLPAYHTSIFVKENPDRTTPGFYFIKDTSIWNANVLTDADYHINDANYSKLETAYQFYYKKYVYNDDEFEKLISADSLSAEATITDYMISPGALNSYFISYSGNYDATDGTIGEGFFEFDVTAIYATLQRYAEQDPILRDKLSLYPLANIKCDSAGEVAYGFINNVLKHYVDIYVSARPIDKNLVPDKEDVVQNSVVLYIDSADRDNTQLQVTNLSATKKERMISIDCELV